MYIKKPSRLTGLSFPITNISEVTNQGSWFPLMTNLKISVVLNPDEPDNRI